MIHAALEVVLDDQLGVRTARVRGPLDVFSAGVVGARILNGLPANTHSVVLELDGIEFIDSAGVSALIRLREHARSRSLDVHVHLGASPRVNPTVLGLLQRVFIVDDIEGVVDLTSDEPIDGAPMAGTSSAGR